MILKNNVIKTIPIIITVYIIITYIKLYLNFYLTIYKKEQTGDGVE